MAGQIARYHIVDFGSVRAATEGAAALIEHMGSPRGLRHMTGPRRAVIWGEGPGAAPADQGRLYLSDGALEAATELRLAFTAREIVPADRLAPGLRLILGDP